MDIQASADPNFGRKVLQAAVGVFGFFVLSVGQFSVTMFFAHPSVLMLGYVEWFKNRRFPVSKHLKKFNF